MRYRRRLKRARRVKKKTTPRYVRRRRSVRRKRPFYRKRRPRFTGTRNYRLYPFRKRNNETFSFSINLRKVTTDEDSSQSLSCTYANIFNLIPEYEGNQMRINFDQFSIEKFGTLIELPAQQKPGKYIPKVFHTYDPDLKGNHYNIDNIKLVQTTRVAVLNGRRRLKLSYKPRYTWRTDDKSYDPNDTMPYPTMFVSGKQKWDMAEAPFGSIPDKAFPQHSVNGIALVVQASKDTVIDYTNFIVIRCYGRRNGAKYTEQIVST